MASDLDRALGVEVQNARNVAGMSRPHVVAILGIPVNTYACYEQGIRPWSFTRFVEVCAVLNVSPLEVFANALGESPPGGVVTSGVVTISVTGASRLVINGDRIHLRRGSGASGAG